MGKYEEALKREDMIKSARKLYKSGWWQSEQLDAVLEEMFPELKESEDERIRKFLINKLEEVGEVWKEYSTKDIITYLEKQKENPKSADSIPSDCVSDAKCGDRWHKVADSLPDTPREVICKDYIGNYFIGRYYEGSHDGSVWEVSVYDDEDKTNENNPEVEMWCEIPSEKKKEQEPAEKSVKWTELTWKDIITIEELINNVRYEFRNGIGQESFGKEVLEKFRDYKGDDMNSIRED